ncbi:hypothetical protein [Singulisphaera acidiphila]|uniref:Uncharacterized protein n=1 Tax=Singulisphaera acidiphila (strain ATCC BAA-1392 / DSM 18658 / VKM B-2454 / MOB10) TaxID=886293 RepID=L0D5Q1_SINAD|nr:hypothetical protein [Singulisphaera acidiphila]AGA24749.1 hypothetical protein Sinac_0303 [Singulisphaera acidiphila DSM 18658]
MENLPDGYVRINGEGVVIEIQQLTSYPDQPHVEPGNRTRK